MTSSIRWQLLADLFETALTIPEPDRADWLQAQSADSSVLAEVEAMLAAHGGPALAVESGELYATISSSPELPSRIGPWRIISSLGRGGMGEVYLGERADGAFDRQVAIKTMGHLSISQRLAQRFARERRIHARLQHPNIAALIDAGVTDDGISYLVMEYVDGQSIADAARNATISEIVSLMRQVCDAVAFAHGQLVLHRDLKPSNILVTSRSEVRLLDFGIATMLEADESDPQAALTVAGERPMTVAYASPEQIRGEELSATSDVYSLGVILYQLLTGERPFNATGNHAIREAIVNREPAAPGARILRGRKIPIARDLQAICLKALEKRPADRYSSAAALADDLRRFSDHRPVIARRPGAMDRLGKLYRRHPVAMPAVAVALIAVLTGFGVATLQANVAARERDIATAQAERAEAVTDVLLDLFDSDPLAETDERRDDVTLREFLTRRAARVREELSDQPALQAELFSLLGNLYAAAGMLTEAEPYALDALRMREALYGDHHLKVADSLDILAKLHVMQGQFDSAVTLQRRSLSIREQQLGDDHPIIAETLNNLSTALSEADDPATLSERIALDRRAMTIRGNQFGEQSLQYAESLNGSASNHLARADPGDLLMAEEMYRKALAIRRQQLGDNHPRTATLMSNLGNLLDDLGEQEEAERMFRDSIRAMKASLGDNHPRVGLPLYGLGHLLIDQERWAEAETTFQASSAINRGTLPADHPYIADDLLALARVAVGMGDWTNAQSRFHSAIDTYLLGGRSIDAAEARNELAEQLIARNQPSEARILLQQNLDDLGRDSDTAAAKQSRALISALVGN